MMKMVKAMYVAANWQSYSKENAFITGAAGGRQAEIGSASAMAADFSFSPERNS